MDEGEYRQYSFARTAAALVLEYSWPHIRKKIDSLITYIQTHSKLIDQDRIALLKATIEDFENCINKIIDLQKPESYEKNARLEEREFYPLVLQLPQIYSEFFDVFLRNVNSTSGDSHTNKPESLQFRMYNSYLRDRKRKGLIKNDKDCLECNYNDGFQLLKQDGMKGQLMQGYWQVESMITELRNYAEHWRKRGGKKFLEEELKRKMIDPISGAEATGNFIILPSIVSLMAYQLLEVLQTWVDTVHLLEM